MTSTGASLHARNLCLGYGRHRVVEEASLDLRAGEVLALVGPNGSGKSTVLRGMARLHAVESGTLHLTEREGSHQPVDCATFDVREFATRLAMLTQQRPTPAGMTVREVVALGRHPHRSKWLGSDPRGGSATARAMELTSIAELADRPVDELSGGQIQRVWLASCLAQQTQVLLLDEPTNHLDLRYQSELLDLIRDLADDHGVAIGVVLHDLNQAGTVADRVALLVEGRIIAEGTPVEVLTQARLTHAYQTPIEVRHDDGYLRVRPLPHCATRNRFDALSA